MVGTGDGGRPMALTLGETTNQRCKPGHSE